MERFTFLLALVGYAGLTVSALLVSRGRLPLWFWRGTAAIIVMHVALVWAVRYEWSVAVATRNGYAGFVIFHGALAMIVVSVVQPHRARPLIYASFAIVTLGALGAVFRYDEVAAYRQMVMALAAVGGIGLLYPRVRAKRVE